MRGFGIFLFILCAPAAAELPQVHPWGSGPPLPALAEAFAQRNSHPHSDPAVHRRVADLLTRILLPKDAGTPIHVVVMDSQVPNMHFVRLATGERAVVMNVGMLPLLGSDDGLAWALGHELEHGTSALQKEVDALDPDSFLRTALKRVVENEVDIKSVIERLHRKGFNPHAARQVLEALRAYAPESLGVSHTDINSRIDAVDFALEALTRIFGERILPDRPDRYRTEVVDSLREATVARPGYRGERLARAQRHLDSLQPPHELYARLLDPAAVSSLSGDGLRLAYLNESLRVWKDLQVHLDQLLDPEEKLAWETRMHERLSALFDTAREALFRRGFRPTSAQQLDALHDLENRTYHLTTLPLNRFREIADLERRKQEIERALPAAAEGRPRDKLRSELAWIERELTRYRAEQQRYETLGVQDKMTPRILALREGSHGGLATLLESTVEAQLALLRDPKAFHSAWFSWERNPPELQSRHREEAQLAYLAGLRAAFREGDSLLTGWSTLARFRSSPELVRQVRELLAEALAPGRPLSHFEAEYLLSVHESFRIPLPDPEDFARRILERLEASRDAFGLSLGLERTRTLLDRLERSHGLAPRPEGELATLGRRTLARLATQTGKSETLLLAEQPDLVARLRLGGGGAQALADVEGHVGRNGSPLSFPNLLVMFDEAHRPRLFDLVARHPDRFQFWEGPYGQPAQAQYALLDWMENRGLDTSAVLLRILDTKEGIPQGHGRFFRHLLATKGVAGLAEAWRGLPFGRFLEVVLDHLPVDLHPDLASRAAFLTESLNQLEAERVRQGATADTRFNRPAHLLAEALKLESARRPLSTEQLLDTLLTLLRAHKSPSQNLDALFEDVWRRTADRPEMRARLRDPDLVGRLFYDSNRTLLAKWQIEQAFGLEAFHRELRGGSRPYPRNDEIRETARAALALLEAQFPERSTLKNEIIEHVEKLLVTSQAENRLFAPARLDETSWQKDRRLAALDLAHVLNRYIRSNFDRLEVVEYLLGVRPEVPDALLRIDERERERAVELAKRARREFREAPLHVRNFMLQPLIAARNGILSEPAAAAELRRLALGEHAGHPVLSALFEAYYESLSESGRKVALGNILASKVDGVGGQASLKQVLDSMGPLGVRAAQFIRSSGIGGEALRRELDASYDHALEPPRKEIFDRLERIFGGNLRGVHGVLPMLGSGAINYAVLADMVDPSDGKVRRVVIRIQRDAVEGLAANESEIWEKAIRRLREHADPEVRRLAEHLSEAREHAMENLRSGGAELDSSRERGFVDLAREAYRSQTPDAGTGLKIDVAEPLRALQALVPEEFQKLVSIYEYVEHSPWRSPAVARQILAAELHALFQKGLFDPDGHPGNWLHSPATGKLVRIDYGQMRRLTDKERVAARAMFGAMLVERPTSRTVATIVESFPDFFDASVDPARLRQAIRRIVGGPAFPPNTKPHERIYFLRNELEKQLGVRIPLTPASQAVLGALVRMNYYREHLPDSVFVSELIERLGVGPVDLAGGYLPLVRQAHASGRLWQLCRGAFAGLLGLK